MKHTILLALTALIFGQVVRAQSTATYEVVFSATWSAETHPDGFPGNPHFSGLIGLSHDSTFTMWEVGETSSAGMERMAELGGKSSLTTEINQAISDGAGFNVLSGGGVGNSPGDVSLMFEVSSSHPLVSLVSMIAPSPDWFVGVRGASLWSDGDWVESRTDTLFVYDAGTDSGSNYTSPNADTDPAEPIERIEASPFLVGDTVVPVGVFTFTRADQQPTATQEEKPQEVALSVYPNPAKTYLDIAYESPYQDQVSLQIYDIMGRLVQEKNVIATHPGMNRYRIELSTLASGTYLLSLTGSSASARQRSVFVLE